MSFKIVFVGICLLLKMAWSKEIMTITLEDADNTPFEKIETQDSLVSVSGFHFDMIQAVAKKLDIEVKWHPLPWSRSIDSIKRGEYDAITYASENTERSEFMYFHPDNLLHEHEVCVVVRKDFKKNKYDGTLASMHGQKVGLAKNYLVSKDVEENKNKFELVETALVGEQVLSMLKARRFDYTFVDSFALKELKTNKKFKNLAVLSPCMTGEKRYIAFSKSKSGYLEKTKRFAAGMKEWKKTPEYRKLLKKYKVE